MALHELDVARLAALAEALEADKAALTGHGVIVPDDTKHDDIADLIRQIRMLLPKLENPAKDSHVVQGLEYIDAGGNKQTGTLVICDTVAPTEGLNGVSGIGVTLEIESSADGSMKIFGFREPNLTRENIKSGVSIFGIQGSLVDGGNEDFANLIGDRSKITSINIPDGITKVAGYAFINCAQLISVVFPQGITSIDMYAFSGCSKLSLAKIPMSIQTIGTYAFRYCTSLTEITFSGTPVTIANNAFANCANMTKINVPWAEGEVANAPWGATNATITYNYTEA